MTDSKERTVQDVFEDERKNLDKIEELKEEIEYVKELRKQLKECKKRKKILEKERESLEINLLKEKKLKWIECNLNEWREYVEENKDDPARYYIYHCNGSIYQQNIIRVNFY